MALSIARTGMNYLRKFPVMWNIPLRCKNTDRRNFPKVFYVQNPLAWLINKFEFRTLRKAFDPSFDEKEFEYGSKKAISVICYYISQNTWDKLHGLLAENAIDDLRREVETNWSDEKRRHIGFDVKDIQIAVPRKVALRIILGDNVADIDMVFVVLKLSEPPPSKTQGVVFIEILAQFTRSYSSVRNSDWTVSKFKISKFDIVR